MGGILGSVFMPGNKVPASVKGTGIVNKAEDVLPPWSVGEGKYSPKNQGTVTNVEHPTGKFDGKSLSSADKGNKTEVAGQTNYPEGMNFNPDLKIHLAKLDGYTQQRGIKGAHNADEFYAAGKEKQIKIVSETPSETKGITNIEYLIPTKDRTGKITGFKENGKNGPFKKTVYDPKVFTDQKMLELSQQAAASGYKEAISKGQRMYDAKAGGIEFRVYLDLDTGRVNNVHPK